MAEGWDVVRFWGDEITKNPDLCANIILEKIIHKNNLHYP